MTSRTHVPSYVHAVRRMNELGGLDMYFAAHGTNGDEWVAHLEGVIPTNAPFFHEGFAVTTRYDDQPDQTLLGRTLDDVAARRGAVVLPGGYRGDSTDTDAPGFRVGDLGVLLQELSQLPEHMITDEHAQEYERLNAIREMRAAVGSVAWLAVYLDSSSNEMSGRPVSLWGRHHQRSLPDMYDRLGVEPIDITVIDDDEQYEELPIHARIWTEDELQAAYAQSYCHARSAYRQTSKS